MKYTHLTDQELEDMRKNVRLQQEALEQLDDALIEEQSRRHGRKIAKDLWKMFNF